MIVNLDKDADDYGRPVLDPEERLVVHIVFQAFKDLNIKIRERDTPKAKAEKTAIKEDANHFLTKRLWEDGNRYGEMLSHYGVTKCNMQTAFEGAIEMIKGRIQYDNRCTTRDAEERSGGE